jgi:hypothetical protein
MTASADQYVAENQIHRLRPLALAALGYVLFVLAVYWPEPRYCGFLWLIFSTKGPHGEQFVKAVCTIAPLVPQLFYFLCAPLHLLRSKAIDIAVLTILRLLAIASFLDIVATPLLAGILGTPAAGGVYLLVSASLFAWVVLLCGIGNRIAERGTVMAVLPAGAPAAFIVAVAAWSILSGVMMAAQAAWRAGGEPYCIAVARSPGPYREITSVFDLRGSHTFQEAIARGPQIMHFHAVLIVQGETERRWFNWSIMMTSWWALPPAPPSSTGQTACKPARNFLLRLVGL